MTEQKITPCLWFDFNAEAAVAHYLSIFKDSRIVSTTHYGEGGPGPAGAVMTILFEIGGQQFLALNGGPQFKFTPALRSSSTATIRPRLTAYGRSSPTAARPASAAGSLTSSASPGRSSRARCPLFF